MNRPNARGRATAIVVAMVVAGCLLAGSGGGATPRALLEHSAAAAATVGSISMTVGTCPPGGDAQAICGNSTNKSHPGAMDLSSVSFGGSNPTTIGSTGPTAGKVHFDSLSLSKSPDNGTTALLSRMATGQQLERVVISFDTPGTTAPPLTILRYTILPSFVTAVAMPTSAGSSTENVSIAIGAVKVEVFTLSPAGMSTPAGTFCWNVITNTATCP